MISSRLLDADTMFDELVSAAAPEGVTAIQALHADSFEEAPFVSWQVSNNGQYDTGLWNVTLILNVVAETLDIFDICSSLYGAARTWAIPGEGVVDGVGGIIGVDDGAVFDRVFDTMIHGKYLSQMSATFNLSIQEM